MRVTKQLPEPETRQCLEQWSCGTRMGCLDLLCWSTCRNNRNSYNVGMLYGSRNDWSYTLTLWSNCSTGLRVREGIVFDVMSI
jgi:hypothetical protein